MLFPIINGPLAGRYLELDSPSPEVRLAKPVDIKELIVRPIDKSIDKSLDESLDESLDSVDVIKESHVYKQEKINYINEQLRLTGTVYVYEPVGDQDTVRCALAFIIAGLVEGN